jgi:hypothetical protein
MDKKTAKRYAAYLEILILFCIAGYIVQNIIIKYLKRDYAEEFGKNKDNPLSMLTASSAESSSTEVFNGIVSNKTKGAFTEYLSFLKPIFDIFQKMFGSLGVGLDILRNTLMPIRNYFASIAMMYYQYIENFTIGILYSMHKFRATMYRSLSGFNLLYHTLEHSKNTIQSISTHRGVTMAYKIWPNAEVTADAKGELGGGSTSLGDPMNANKIAAARRKGQHGCDICFDSDTLIRLKSEKYVKICNIELDSILEDGSVVIARHKFINNEYLYKYDGIYVTGSHIVKENNKWTTIKNSSKSTRVFICPEFVYCISTNTGTILINNVLFKDYNESVNKYTNFTINSLILMDLNNEYDTKINNNYAYETNYLDSGFHRDTLIEMNSPTLKSIKNINIGDILFNNNEVTGKIEISGKHLSFYKDSSIIVSSNMKTKTDGIWKNIEKTINCKEYIYNGIAYNLITKSGEIMVFNKRLYKDYTETNNKYINDQITDIILAQ